MCWLLSACALLPVRGMMAQNLHVLVLDALNGRPQANVKVEYFCTRPQHNSAYGKALTNNGGVATFPNPCIDDEKIEMAIYPPDKKEQCGDDAVMTPKDVASAGFLSKPDSAGGIWCPTKVSKKLKPVPGQVTLFVKKPTWWQSHVAG
jgi:hypothetical protein